MVKSSDLSVSILIATLNSARVLPRCLSSITEQDYPRSKVTLIVADGGSIDQTRQIAKKYGAKIYSNPLKTGEAGKAVALTKADGDLVALIDSDNYLPTKNWLKKMVAPFTDQEILGSEPWEFTYRKNDSLVNRYCALIGVNDPYCYFVGNYDKRSVLSNNWTNLKLDQEDKGGYLKVKIQGEVLPTIGANGTVWRTKALKKAVGKNDYLFDTDIPYALSRTRPFSFAKVKVGIIHDYCPQVKDFYRKQKRRAKDFFYLESKKERGETFQRLPRRQLRFILSVITLVPLIFQAIKGYWRKPDSAWLFHPLACLATLWIYSTETIRAWFKKEEFDRASYSQ
jgi:glycosyltransferase involved in cell wall biosynthesis